jgi:hypothetical protein
MRRLCPLTLSQGSGGAGDSLRIATPFGQGLLFHARATFRGVRLPGCTPDRLRSSPHVGPVEGLAGAGAWVTANNVDGVGW